MTVNAISRQTLKRLPSYLELLKKYKLESKVENISATTIAQLLKLGHVQVRKDLACISDKGRPRVGYNIEELIRDIENFLGCNNTSSAVLIGSGHLGMALMSYDGFLDYGLEIVAAFDIDDSLIGTEQNGIKIFSMDKFEDLCRRLNVHIGIVTVPPEYAQDVCELLIQSGIKAIWNFAATHIEVPDDIIVKNENLAASLALLSNSLANEI